MSFSIIQGRGQLFVFSPEKARSDRKRCSEFQRRQQTSKVELLIDFHTTESGPKPTGSSQMTSQSDQHKGDLEHKVDWTGWTPVLQVANVARSIRFYCDLLGFHEDWIHRFEEDFPAYASVSRDPLILHLSEHEGGGTKKADLFVHVMDVDSVYEEVNSNGLVSNPPVTESEIGLRQFEFDDPDGHQITFGTGIQFLSNP